MRISEIKPGMWVAVPAPHALLQATREGMSALPAKVIAIGNFRMKADRGCVPEILDDHFRQTVHVQRLNISMWDNKQRRELFGIGFRQMVPMSLSAPGWRVRAGDGRRVGGDPNNCRPCTQRPSPKTQQHPAHR